jgi:hypothetical protein
MSARQPHENDAAYIRRRMIEAMQANGMTAEQAKRDIERRFARAVRKMLKEPRR